MKSGGAHGLAKCATRCANSPKRVQFSAWLMGLSIFFDDYANALITGTTMRPISDTMLISREKLSFIVDCCAATISSIFFVSSWVGVEVAFIQDQFKKLGIKISGFDAFISSVPYSFYPLTIIFFCLMTIITGR